MGKNISVTWGNGHMDYMKIRIKKSHFNNFCLENSMDGEHGGL